MSEGRIATELWVMAHIRQCNAQGIMATVVKRGDDWGGAVVIKLNMSPFGLSLKSPAMKVGNAGEVCSKNRFISRM